MTKARWGVVYTRASESGEELIFLVRSRWAEAAAAMDAVIYLVLGAGPARAAALAGLDGASPDREFLQTVNCDDGGLAMFLIEPMDCEMRRLADVLPNAQPEGFRLAPPSERLTWPRLG